MFSLWYVEWMEMLVAIFGRGKMWLGGEGGCEWYGFCDGKAESVGCID